MKTLTLIRHAKSSWEYDVIDHERPLNKRGINDAKLLSSYLKRLNPQVDLVFCSDATRTKATAAFFIESLCIDLEQVIYNYELYDFDGRSLQKVIQECPDAVNYLMVFAHNHAVTSFVNTFGCKYIENVPTCGLITIKFDIDRWQDLKQGTTTKTIFPRDLK
ncbi:SixA phosphatase family protein [Cognatitamlana onchidii]|uniref:SixA phosphatase family protein n=1 Tax=Cognatitamlana onchidii TaxID=2562860 RepID=UPI0010A67127|nr:histidine phosphatase family protein [Algibacter onchidii]